MTMFREQRKQKRAMMTRAERKQASQARKAARLMNERQADRLDPSSPNWADKYVR